MRGLACVLMFQTHAYDAWLSPEARKSTFFMYSQLVGTLPAPMFLFLAGISFALVTEKLLRKALPAGRIARTTIRRGAEILGLGLLFRLQEYLIAWGWAPWSDLLRIDILNTIGVSMMLMGLLCWVVLSVSGLRSGGLIGPAAVGIALAISLLSPLIWTRWRPDWLPWPIQSYFDGAHNLGEPQAWLFPIFPWSAFAFAGLAVGFLMQSDWAGQHEKSAFVFTGLAGIALIEVARWLEAQPRRLYSTYDFWHTSPNFFLIPRRTSADPSFRQLRLVPLGVGTSRVQPLDSARADFPAGLLGSHRTGLRTLLHIAQACTGRPGSIARAPADLSDDAGAVAGAHQAQGTRSGSLGMDAEAGSGQLTRLSCARSRLRSSQWVAAARPVMRSGFAYMGDDR